MIGPGSDKNQKFWGIVLDFVVLKQMSFGFDSANTMVVGCVLVLAIVVIAFNQLGSCHIENVVLIAIADILSFS